MNLLQKIEAKKNQKAKQERNKKIAIATSGVALGTVVGAVAGVLAAPKSGKETIADAKENIAEAKEKLSENIKNTKTKVTESQAKIKEYLNSRKSEEAEEVEVEIFALEEQAEAEDVEA
ncbi:MAG: YtxH domain-containing protein [bacterium]|nr:YtxH domain-containing protein [bacterium]